MDFEPTAPIYDDIMLTDGDMQRIYMQLTRNRSHRETWNSTEWAALNRTLKWDHVKCRYRVIDRSRFLMLKLRHGF